MIISDFDSEIMVDIGFTLAAISRIIKLCMFLLKLHICCTSNWHSGIL